MRNFTVCQVPRFPKTYQKLRAQRLTDSPGVF